MILTELNQTGDFTSWDQAKLNEIKKGDFSEEIGVLLFENDCVKLWEVVLKPTERMPFRRHRSNYSCTSFTDGLLLSRNINGQVALIRIDKGGTRYLEHAKEETTHDLENIGDNEVRMIIIEEKISDAG